MDRLKLKEISIPNETTNLCLQEGASASDIQLSDAHTQQWIKAKQELAGCSYARVSSPESGEN